MTLSLSLRLLWRDWRAGELRILFAALVIAVTATTAVGFFTDRLQRAMASQSAGLLGGDLLVQSPRPLADGWLAAAADAGLAHTRVLTFPSVVAREEQLQLSGIKAVEEGYPLRGELRVADHPYGVDRAVAAIPPPGEAWVEARLLPLLRMEVGETLELGAIALRVSGVLSFEPGLGGGFFALAPRVLMNARDVARAGVLQPGSRVEYQYLFAGGEAALQGYQAWLEPRLEPSQRLRDVRAGQPSVGAALERAEQYLGLASLVAVLLAGVAIAMGARRYAERHFDVSAMLRCLGAAQRDILALFLPQLLLLALAGSAIGVGLGYLAQQGLFHLLRELLPARLPAPGLLPVLLGFLTGLVVLAGFALPPVLRLRQVPALRVLRRELAPMPLRGWLVYGAALGAMALLMWRYTGSAVLTFGLIGGTLAALVLLGLPAWLLLRASRVLRPGLGVAWRQGFQHVWRQPLLGISQILAFGLTFMAMALIALVRGDLLASWQSQLPAGTPNHFVVNVLPDRLEAFQDFLRQRDIADSGLYPLVRGRLAAVNGEPPASRLPPGEEAPGAVNRELNLTWRQALPPGNRLTAGHWWSTGSRGEEAVVSVEAGLAQRLGVGLGDTLQFSFGQETLAVTVTSLRRLQWDSFQPNFFMIFPPGLLDGQPATYMTSFFLPAERKGELADMLRQFPAVTVIDLDRIMDQVRGILHQVTLAVEFVLVFVLLAGFAVLYAALQASLDERLHEGALLRTLGASRHQLRAGHIAEFGLLGLLAGLLAALGTDLVARVLYARVFGLAYGVQWWLWWLLPLGGALLIGLAGVWGTRRVVRQSPLVVLRDL
jgi:putative ABC transport system permease protein